MKVQSLARRCHKSLKPVFAVDMWEIKKKMQVIYNKVFAILIQTASHYSNLLQNIFILLYILPRIMLSFLFIILCFTRFLYDAAVHLQGTTFPSCINWGVICLLKNMWKSEGSTSFCCHCCCILTTFLSPCTSFREMSHFLLAYDSSAFKVFIGFWL